MSKSTKADKADKADKVWAIMALASGPGAAKPTHHVHSTGWTASSGRNPPPNPPDPDVRLV